MGKHIKRNKDTNRKKKEEQEQKQKSSLHWVKFVLFVLIFRHWSMFQLYLLIPLISWIFVSYFSMLRGAAIY